jgi:hypothetical protein
LFDRTSTAGLETIFILIKSPISKTFLKIWSPIQFKTRSRSIYLALIVGLALGWGPQIQKGLNSKPRPSSCTDNPVAPSALWLRFIQIKGSISLPAKCPPVEKNYKITQDLYPRSLE